ncbi:MAG: hypothetical protein QM765_12250 [Myxococcales bacterium]
MPKRTTVATLVTALFVAGAPWPQAQAQFISSPQPSQPAAQPAQPAQPAPEKAKRAAPRESAAPAKQPATPAKQPAPATTDDAKLVERIASLEAQAGKHASELTALRAELETLRAETTRLGEAAKETPRAASTPAPAEPAEKPTAAPASPAPAAELAASTSASPAPSPAGDPAPAPSASSTPAAAQADPASAPPAAAAPAPASTPLGLTLDLGFASAYNFRGYNVYQATSQGDQHGALVSILTWTIPGTGVSLSYISAYQTNGPNRAAVNAVGFGSEQDLSVGYGTTLADGLVGINAALTFYAYPFAKADVAGTEVPAYLEPSLTLSLALPVDVSLSVLYYAGLQEAVKDYRYLYVRPAIGKTLTLSERLSVGFSFYGGYKRFADAEKMKTNVWDVGVDGKLSIRIVDALSIVPAAHVSWTNVHGAEPSDGLMVWGSLNAVVNL